MLLRSWVVSRTRPALSSGLLVSLPPSPQYTNHLGNRRCQCPASSCRGGQCRVPAAALQRGGRLRPGRPSAGGQVPQIGARPGLGASICRGRCVEPIVERLRTKGRALIRGERRGRRRGLDGGSIGSRGMVHRPSRGNRLTSGMQPPSPRHLPTSATGTGWERTPWHATQRAAWEALRTARY